MLKKFNVAAHTLIVLGLTTAIGAAVAQSAPAPTAPPPANATTAAKSLADQLPVPDAPAPKVSKAWLVMDYTTGQILAGDKVDERVDPASITKVMTSYVIAAEMKAGKVKADDDVMMTENAWRKGGAGTDGSYSGFQVNTTAKLVEMEKGMVVQSGNDAAIALAEHVAGSEEAFAQLMNMYAGKIGMKNTHFTNATGLTDENHYTTAHDLALLGQALIRDFPEAYSYNKIKKFTVGDITQQNRNLLLWRDSSVDGIKTGHTSAAGYCLMASAMRGPQRLISVVMGDSSENQRAVDSQALLNWGFRFYESHQIYKAGDVVATQRLWKGKADEIKLGTAQPMIVSLPRGKYNQLKPTMDIPKTIVAPIKRGQKIGNVKVTLDGKVIATQPLVALDAVEEAGFFGRLWDSLMMWWDSV